MKKIVLFAAVLALATSCTVSYPGMATGNEIVKKGEIKSKIWFGIGNVDMGIAAAAKKGGITKVATVDYSVKPGLFNVTYKIMVTGN